VTEEEGWDLRAHESARQRLDEIGRSTAPDRVWEALIALLRRVMDDPDSCRTQAIRWPRSDICAYRVSSRCEPYEIQVWWSKVNGASYVWGITFDPPLD
jgi:hypothetical protein